LRFIRYNAFYLLFHLLLMMNFTQSFALDKLTLVLDWFENPNHAPLFVANDLGFFKKEGLDITILTPADPTDPGKWTAMGKVDLALDYQPHVLLEIAKGLPILQVGTLINKPLNCLVVLEKGPVHRLQDLRGRAVGYSSPQIDLVILEAMLKKEGVSLKEVQAINVHYDLTQALLSHKVAAAVGMMRNFEPIQLRLLGQPARTFYPENYGVPLYSELVFIAPAKRLQSEKLSRFFKALDAGRAYLIAHPEESWQRFIAQYPVLNTPSNKRAWFETLPKFAAHSQGINIEQCKEVGHFLGQYLTADQKALILHSECK